MVQITKFAPAERAGPEKLAAEAAGANPSGVVELLLNAVVSATAILNRERQIVFANRAFWELAAHADIEGALGLRFGEALGCQWSNDMAGGCGASDGCRTCGVLQATLGAVSGRQSRECRIMRLRADGQTDWLDLQVTCTTAEIGGHALTVLVAEDVSDKKRRQAIERIFFHDVMNKVAGLRGLSDLLEEATAGTSSRELASLVGAVSGEIAEDIEAQRALTDAESGELQVSIEPVNSLDLIASVSRLYANHTLTIGRKLVIHEAAAAIDFNTDPRLFSRVLGNMVKNALEASRSDQTVLVGCDRAPRHVRFWVHNSGEMNQTVRVQIFQRSFSTKGSGRGLGTYSIKLLTEKYLKGVASFESTSEGGTTFYALLPLG